MRWRRPSGGSLKREGNQRKSEAMNVAEKLAHFSDHWAPRTIAQSWRCASGLGVAAMDTHYSSIFPKSISSADLCLSGLSLITPFALPRARSMSDTPAG
jgi:hypothetical protein